MLAVQTRVIQGFVGVWGFSEKVCGWFVSDGRGLEARSSCNGAGECQRYGGEGGVFLRGWVRSLVVASSEVHGGDFGRWGLVGLQDVSG